MNRIITRLNKTTSITEIKSNYKYFFNDDNNLFLETYTDNNKLIGEFDYNKNITNKELMKIIDNIAIIGYHVNNDKLWVIIKNDINSDEYTSDDIILKNIVKNN